MTENLILFGFSGFDSPKVANLTSWASQLPDCAVVLMEDGILGTVKPQGDMTESLPYAKLLESNISVHVLNEDLLARGYDPTTLHDGIMTITYSDLMDTIESATRVMSWL